MSRLGSVKYHKFQIIWILFLIASVSIIFLIKQFLFDYQNIESNVRNVYVILVVVGFSFVTVFVIFSFTKIYEKGKKSIEKSIGKNSFSLTSMGVFIGYSMLITAILVLMIRTGSTNYAVTAFPPIKSVIDTVASFQNLDVLLGVSLDNNLIFRYTFASLGIGILLLLRHVHMNKNQPEKYPGTRSLMLFFFSVLFWNTPQGDDIYDRSVYNHTYIRHT